jgi:hypothetical protein
MRRSTLARAAVAVVAVTVFSGVGATPAGAGTSLTTAVDPGVSLAGLPRGFTSWQQLFDAQRPLDEAATQIEAAAHSNPRSGFTSVRVDAESNLLTLYWQGAPAKAERNVIDTVRARGITVKLVGARYSQTQLDAQVDLIARDAVRAAGERVVSITKRPDGSGVTVGVDPGPAQAMSRSALGRSLPNLQAAAGQGAITVVAVPKQPRPNLLRENDGRPFYGGALIRGPLGVCTSGFAVHWPGVGDYMTTAAHCGWPGISITNGVWNIMGVMTDGNFGYDLRFIRTTGTPGSSGVIYTGSPVYAAGQTTTPVTRASHTHIGDWLCVSGALRGLRCSIRASGPTIDCRDRVEVIGLGNANGCFYVEGGISSVGELFVGHGDSGGPIFVPINGINQPNSRADARGLVSAIPVGWEFYDCLDPTTGTIGEDCTTAVWFTDILDAIAPWAASGMRVKTG